MSFRTYLDELNENSVSFDGKNAKEIKSFLSKNGYELKEEQSGKKTVVIDGKETTIFKDDVISLKGKKIVIKKPSYVKEAEENVSPKEKEYLSGVLMGQKAKGKWKGTDDDAALAMIIKSYLEDKSKFDFKG